MADVKMSELSADVSVAGDEKILVLDNTTSKTMTVDVLVAYAIDELVGAAEITPTAGDAFLVERDGTEGTYAIADAEAWVVDTIEAVSVGTEIVDTDDHIIYMDAGTLKRITLQNFASGITLPGTRLDIDGTTEIGGALADADEFIVDDGGTGTNKACLMSRVSTYIIDKLEALDLEATPVDADHLVFSDDGTLKRVTVANLWDNRYETDMLAVSDVSGATWVLDQDEMDDNDDTKVPTQQSVKAYVDAQAEFSVHDTTKLNAAPETTDYMAVSDEDVEDDPNRGVTVEELFTAAGNVTDLAAAPATDDRLLLTDESETGDPARSMTVQNLFDTMNANLTEFTSGTAIVPGTDQVLIDDDGTAKRTDYQTFMDGMDDLDALAAAPATTDTIMVGDAGTAKNMTVQNLFNTVNANLTEFTSGTAFVRLTDQVLVDDGGTAKRASYQTFMDGIDDLAALGAAPAAADTILVGDSGTAKNMTVQNLFNTVNANLTEFTSGTAIVRGTDQVLLDDGGTAKRASYQTFMDGVNDLEALGAPPATTDNVLIDDAGTAKKCTVANLLDAEALSSYSEIVEDFYGDVGDTLPPPWTTDTQTSATADYMANEGCGVFQLATTDDDQADAGQLTWGDNLMIDLDNDPIVEFRVRIDGIADLESVEKIIIGVMQAHANAEDDAGMDNKDYSCWFMLKGDNDLNIYVETDDAVTDNDDRDSGVNLVDDTWTLFKIDFSTLSDVTMTIDGTEQSYGTLNFSNAAGQNVQPIVLIQRKDNTQTEAVIGVEIDYIKVRQTR